MICSRLASGPMSTSPQRGHVVRIVVITPAISDGGAPRLSPRTEEETTLSVPFAGPFGELADALVQPGRIDHLGVRPQAEQEALEPFEPAGGELDLQAAVPELHLARGLVVLGHPSRLGPQADDHPNVVLRRRVQGPARAPEAP